MKKNEYDPLFERTYIGNLGIRNRFVMAPMGMGVDMNGTVGPDGLDYYEERAKGGTGMLIIGNMLVTKKTDPDFSTYWAVDTTLQEWSWCNLVERVKSHGTAVCLQLGSGLGRNARIVPGKENVSASVNPNFRDPSTNTRALSVSEIHDIVEGFGRAAMRAKRSGCDAVEIHAHLGYLMDQFMTPLWNRREDEYGGSFENRMRYPTEAYQEIRRNVGPDFPVTIRLSTEHKIPGGRTLEEGDEIIRYLDKLGIDGFNIDGGCYEAYDWGFPTIYMDPGCMDNLSARVKSITNKPVLNAGAYTPEAALKSVTEGKTDFIVIGRGLLADPEYANKLREGRREDIRPCLRCNEYCLRKAMQHPLSCSVNAAAGAEKLCRLTKTASPKKIVVVGGGPAGLEAARVSAAKGHKVTLYEKGSALGGQVIPAAAPPFKTQTLGGLIKYFKTQLDKLGVDVRLNKEITETSPELRDADRIIVAVGAHPFIPPVKGADGPNILEVTDMHLGDASRIGKKVIVAGGGPSGCDCAIELAMDGKEVCVIEMLNEIYPAATLDNKVSVTRLFGQYNIKTYTGHRILEFTSDGLKAEAADGVKELKADTVILAFGTRPNAEAAKKLLDSSIDAVMIGDCTRIGQIGEAVRSGFYAGWGIV